MVLKRNMARTVFGEMRIWCELAFFPPLFPFIAGKIRLDQEGSIEPMLHHIVIEYDPRLIPLTISFEDFVGRRIVKVIHAPCGMAVHWGEVVSLIIKKLVFRAGLPWRIFLLCHPVHDPAVGLLGHLEIQP